MACHFVIELTDGVEQFANVGGLQHVLGTQDVGDEAADNHEYPHGKVRQSGDQAVLHISRTQQQEQR